MHMQPFTRSRWFYRSVVAALIIVAGLVGYTIHRPTDVVKTKTVVLTQPTSKAGGASTGGTGVAAGAKGAAGGAGAGAGAKTGAGAKAAGATPAGTKAGGVKAGGSANTGANQGAAGTSAARSGGVGSSGSKASTTGATARSTARANTTVTYRLALGAPLYNMCVYLASHHIVNNAMAFDLHLSQIGVDKTVRPGTYTFHVGMSEQQVVNILRNGPNG